jgi:hypothetical protein
LLDQTFTNFTGPTAALTLDIGVYEFTFSTLSLGTLLLEVQQVSGVFVGRHVLNTHRIEGTAAVAVGAGVDRFNYGGPGLASASISGP